MSHDERPPLAVVESQPVAEAPARRFTLIRAADLKTRAVDWLIQDYLEADTLSLVFGDPGCGKSFLAIDAACCVAADVAFHDKTVRHAPVVYIAGEGQNGLARRFNAWSIRHGIPLDDLPLYVSTGPAALCDAESALDVRQAVDEIAEAEGSPGLVVVDTLARNFGAGDENSTQEMGAVIQALDAIRSHHQATVLLVHHTGHGDKQRARGAMALKGALDAEFRMDKADDGVIRLQATKMKDAPEPEPLAFRLRTVELEEGVDDPPTSAVLDGMDYVPAPKARKAGRGKHQTKALEVLEQLHHQQRQTKEANGQDPAAARVSLGEWRQAMQDSGVPRPRTYDIPKALASAGQVTIDHGFVQLCA